MYVLLQQLVKMPLQATILFAKYSSSCNKRSTIFALSTPLRMSAIAVVRISGPNAASALLRVGKFKKLPSPRKAVLCSLKDPESEELLDRALVIWFPGPNSYTGEDLCELHIHGGVAVIRSVLNALEKLTNFRHAQPGEFTKRAFIANKLDLTEVEGLADLLHAETAAQQKLALQQMHGSLHKLYSGWSDKLKKCLSRIEAYIDFSEDQHLDNIFLDEVTQDVASIAEEAKYHLKDKRKGEKIRAGIHTAIIGPPNVGKSSLLNALCQRDIAIVSSSAGTTRDIIESSFNLDGFLVNIADTAGIRETSDQVEKEGVRRALMRSSDADFLIVVLEASQVLEAFKTKKDINCILHNHLGEDFLSSYTHNDRLKNSTNTIILLNKMDLLCDSDQQKLLTLEENNPSICGISCISGRGMNSFLGVFTERVKNLCSGPVVNEPTITQDRHRRCVKQCVAFLSEYENYLHHDVAIAAEKLRQAMNALGCITGKVTTEDLLDVIFKDFCIGK